MEIVIVTGMSGAGKSSALNIFEDLGYYSMDNLPTELIIDFAKLISRSEVIIDKLAVGIDIRGIGFEDTLREIEKLEESDFDVNVLYLDCADEILVQRYKEKRRPHPMERYGNLLNGIKLERKSLLNIKARANHVIDTSSLRLSDLKDRIYKIYNDDSESNMVVSIVSFGFKHGILLDADLVFDVRFLPNPYYLESLRDKTGKDKEIVDYIFSFEETNKYVELLMDLFEFSIPLYEKEGKSNLVIGIGCTGGKHRSVAIAEHLGSLLAKKFELIFVNHRDEREW